MKDIDVGQIRPENPNGLEKYKFTMPSRAQVLVYHYTEYKSPFGKPTEDWLCCTEGWYLRDDGKWHETVRCGFSPDRVVDTINDIFDVYREKATKTLNVTIRCAATYKSRITVPADMDLESAIAYAKENIHDAPCGELEYVPGFNELDEEKCEFEANVEDCLYVRPLAENDRSMVEKLDESSENYVAFWLEDNDNYAWGLFLNEELIGYCTIGGADDVPMIIADYPGYCTDSLLLGDVYIVPKMRKKGYGLYMVQSVLETRVKDRKEHVFLTVLDDHLGHFYEKAGFKMLREGNMVRPNLAELFSEIKHQLDIPENVTQSGEPQGFLSLPNGRSLEVTLESSGLPEEECFYSGRLHCSEEEFDNGIYAETMGVITLACTKTPNFDEVKGLLLLLLDYDQKQSSH